MDDISIVAVSYKVDLELRHLSVPLLGVAMALQTIFIV